eukprot:PLAT12551.19.p1 GENE.PLAT12551.19~~PLAT12551.19.p1  ORF type:complete len:565 (-),score=331.97 PLAT12551.19:177-1871(-)
MSALRRVLPTDRAPQLAASLLDMCSPLLAASVDGERAVQAGDDQLQLACLRSGPVATAFFPIVNLASAPAVLLAASPLLAEADDQLAVSLLRWQGDAPFSPPQGGLASAVLSLLVRDASSGAAFAGSAGSDSVHVLLQPDSGDSGRRRRRRLRASGLQPRRLQADAAGLLDVHCVTHVNDDWLLAPVACRCASSVVCIVAGNSDTALRAGGGRQARRVLYEATPFARVGLQEEEGAPLMALAVLLPVMLLPLLVTACCRQRDRTARPDAVAAAQLAFLRCGEVRDDFADQRLSLRLWLRMRNHSPIVAAFWPAPSALAVAGRLQRQLLLAASWSVAVLLSGLLAALGSPTLAMMIAAVCSLAVDGLLVMTVLAGCTSELRSGGRVTGAGSTGRVQTIRVDSIAKRARNKYRKQEWLLWQQEKQSKQLQKMTSSLPTYVLLLSAINATLLLLGLPASAALTTLQVAVAAFFLRELLMWAGELTYLLLAKESELQDVRWQRNVLDTSGDDGVVEMGTVRTADAEEEEVEEEQAVEGEEGDDDEEYEWVEEEEEYEGEEEEYEEEED